jgi:aspartate aminotransferase-like enzyme
MIAVAKDFDVARDLMTVQQVMDEIGARAPSTITRLIKAQKLKASRIGAMGWLVHRDSVEAFKAAEAAAKPSVGFPRGGVRAKGKPDKTAKASKPAKKARRR